MGRTRTAPAADARVGLRFALASCQRYDHGHYAAWRHIANAELDLVLFVGDYIYEYASPPMALRRHEGLAVRTLEQYRARYAQYKSDPLLQAAHAALPWLTVWDDHEVDNDYAASQGQALQTDFAAQRAAAYRAYWEHMPFPKALQAHRRRHAHLWPHRLGRAGLHPRARRSPVPRSAGLPARRARRLQQRAAARLPRARPIRNVRCSVRRRSAGSPKAGICSARGTWWRNRP